MRRSEPGGVSGSMLAGPASPCGALWLPCAADPEKGDALGAPAAETGCYQRARIRPRASLARKISRSWKTFPVALAIRLRSKRLRAMACLDGSGKGQG